QASSTSTPAASVSTLGNSGLLAAYLLLTIAIAGYLAATNVRYRLLYLSVAGVNLLALIYAENRSTLLGLAIGGFAGTLIFAMLGTRSRRKWIAPGIAGAAGVIVFAAA